MTEPTAPAPKPAPAAARPPLFDRRYLVPRLLLAAGLCGFWAFGFDPLLRGAAVQIVGRAAGVRPDLATVRTSLFPTRIDLTGFALPDPDRPTRNLVTFDRLTADLDPAALLRGRAHVTTGTLSGLTFGAARDGAAGRLDPLRVSLLSPADLRPVCDGLLTARGALGALPDLLAEGDTRLAGESETVLVARRLRGEWGERLDDLETRGAALHDRSKTLSDRLDAAASADDPIDRLRALAEVTRDAAALLADADALRRELPAFAAAAREDRAALAAAKTRDVARLKDLASLVRLDADAAARSLLGPALSQRLTATLAVARWLRDRLGDPAALPGPAPPARGVRIPFPATDPRPAVLLERLAVTGTLPTDQGPLPFAGTLTGLTTDPALHGGPLAGSFTAVADPQALGRPGASGGGPRFTVQFTHDASTGEPVTDLEVRVAATVPHGATASLGSVPLAIAGPTDEVPASLDWTARLRLTGRGPDAAVDGVIDLQLKARLGGGGDTRFARAVNDAAADLGGLSGALHLSGRASAPRWRLETEVGDRLVASLQTQVEQAAAEQANALLAAADDAETRFLADLSGRWGEVTGGLTHVAAVAERLGGRAPRNGRGFIERTAARVPVGGRF